MFDDVSVRVWLIILIGLTAYPQAQYVARHVANAPSRQDITQPRPDLSWRTSAQLVRSLVVLGLLSALAVFIFTPAAESFAQSPRFWPILVLGFGVWALYTVALSLASGRIEPLVGFSNTYERGLQPKRFWASLSWNAALGSLMLWLAYQQQEEASVNAGWDRCFAAQSGIPDATNPACRALLATYDQSVRRDSLDYASRYNRGLVFRQLGDDRRAMEDFSAVIKLKPDDSDAYFERGLIYLGSREYDKAILDFDRAHELDAKDPWPLANRGLAYAWKQDPEKAERDFASTSAIDPDNVVVMRGRALLRMQEADLQGAIKHLSDSLEGDPDNVWALRMRAWNYRQADEPEKAQADEDRVRQLSQR